MVVVVASLTGAAAAADCPEFMGSEDTPMHSTAVAVSGGYAYVADSGSGLRVLDVSTPSAPVEVGFFDTPGVANHVAISDGYVYLSDRYTLAVFRECTLFSDGFESGDTSGWSATVP
jgi:hypothetical protein